MKKTILFMAFAIATLSMTSCKSEPKTEPTKEVVTETATKSGEIAYACPMDCEKGKLYTNPGKCPVCEMDLTETTVAAESHEGHDHQGHEDHKH